MLSIIIPFYNESESLPTLIKRLIEVCDKLPDKYEIVLVDDGSDDNLEFKIQNLELTDKNKRQLVLLNHRKRFGKGEALATGIKNAKGDIIFFMDGDLQDDPADIPQFLKKIDNGYDFVNGVRSKRKDKILVKVYSFFAKLFLEKFLNSPYTDINCGFKAFKKKVLENFVFYGNNFRFFPLSVFYRGFQVTEIPVINNPRLYGKSKFGPTKLFIGILDMLNTYFIYKFSEQPLHFFGPIGGIMFVSGMLINIYLVYERIFLGVLLYRRPLLLFGILFTIVGLQILMTGIVAELTVYLNKRITSS